MRRTSIARLALLALAVSVAGEPPGEGRVRRHPDGPSSITIPQNLTNAA
jgi:hypothetical protein